MRTSETSRLGGRPRGQSVSFLSLLPLLPLLRLLKNHRWIHSTLTQFLAKTHPLRPQHFNLVLVIHLGMNVEGPVHFFVNFHSALWQP